jgi:hypothetical protein
MGYSSFLFEICSDALLSPKATQMATDLMNAQVTFLTPRLAKHYGLDPSDSVAGTPQLHHRATTSSSPTSVRRITAGLQVLYSFDEGSGETVRDVPVELLGQVGPDRIYVSGPFRNDDELIVRSSRELPDGTRVRPRRAGERPRDEDRRDRPARPSEPGTAAPF